MFIIAVQFYVSSYEISGGVLDDFFTGTYDYDTNSEFVDFVQIKFACCGIENYTSWDLNRAFTDKETKIPDSCCKPEFHKCDRNNATQLFNVGCAKAIINWPEESVYIFLILWSVLIILSIGFCYLFKKISEDSNRDKIVLIRALFKKDKSESLLDYQNSFKKCNPKQIVYPSNQIQKSSSNEERVNEGLNKFTKYSQIKYSKVKPTKQNLNKNDDEVDLTCNHPDDEESSREDSYTEDDRFSSSNYSTNDLYDENIYKKMNNLKLTNRKDVEYKKNINKNEYSEIDQNDKKYCTKIKSSKTNNKKNQILNKSIEENKKKYSLSSNSASSSPELDDSQIDNRNLIHRKNVDKMYKLDKLKNKFIEPYSDDSSYLTDHFDDKSDFDHFIDQLKRKGKIFKKSADFIEYNLNERFKKLNQVLNGFNLDYRKHNWLNLKKLDDKLARRVVDKKIRYLN